MHMTTVDNWSQTPIVGPSCKETVEQNVAAAGLADIITVKEGDSTEVGKVWTRDALCLLFVDADHAQHAVLADVTAWWPHLQIDGLIAFHDSNSQGVGAALKVFEKDYPVRLLGHVGSIRAYIRV